MSDITIGRLSDATGVKIETIRYYEKIGIMPNPPRTSGGQRIYSAAHQARLGFIKRSRDLGFSLDAVRSLLGLSDEPPSCGEVHAITTTHLEEVRVKIDDLKSPRSARAATHRIVPLSTRWSLDNHRLPIDAVAEIRFGTKICHLLSGLNSPQSSCTLGLKDCRLTANFSRSNLRFPPSSNRPANILPSPPSLAFAFRPATCVCKRVQCRSPAYARSQFRQVHRDSL